MVFDLCNIYMCGCVPKSILILYDDIPITVCMSCELCEASDTCKYMHHGLDPVHYQACELHH